jgi:hypothetical protein
MIYLNPSITFPNKILHSPLRNQAGLLSQSGRGCLIFIKNIYRPGFIKTIQISIYSGKKHGRQHASLIPEGARLSFAPKGKVFRMAE